eukprot:07225_4
MLSVAPSSKGSSRSRTKCHRLTSRHALRQANAQANPMFRSFPSPRATCRGPKAGIRIVICVIPRSAIEVRYTLKAQSFSKVVVKLQTYWLMREASS